MDTLEQLSTPLVLFGVGSTVLVVLNQVPQYRKILKTQSAEGLSEITLGIGNVASSFNVINLTILHANQAKLCFANMPSSLLACQSSFLVLYSGLCGFLACFPYYLLKLKMTAKYKDTLSSNRMVLGLYLQMAIILAAAVPALLSVLPTGTCERYRDYANTIGFLNTVLLCAQYLPQIYTSYTFKGSGAVSYATLGLDALGGYVMTFYRIYGTSERLSSWLPYLVFHSSELVVILVALYFDTQKRYKKTRKKKAWMLGGLDPLDRYGNYNDNGSISSSPEGSPLL